MKQVNKFQLVLQFFVPDYKFNQQVKGEVWIF